MNSMIDEKQKTRYNLHAKDLKPFEPGTVVWIQNADTGKWDTSGNVICQLRNRTYKIEFENGRMTCRNCKRMRRKYGLHQTPPAKRNHEGGHQRTMESSKDTNPKPR